MNTKIGVDVSMEELEKDYDAVLFAIGRALYHQK
jgi:NADPH-dependent glutamate synthase beta subunit-like oxidoreductase